jgi:uncharacterized protein
MVQVATFSRDSCSDRLQYSVKIDLRGKSFCRDAKFRVSTTHQLFLDRLIDLALRHPDAAGLIVESSFTSIRELVAHRNLFWMFPIDFMLTQRFESIKKIPRLKMPVLFIHGTADLTVPSFMSQKLYAAAPEPKTLILVPGAGHNDMATVAGSQYLQWVKSFVFKKMEPQM